MTLKGLGFVPKATADVYEEIASEDYN